MPVLSVDLASRNWSDLGVVLLEQKGPLIACEIIRWSEPYPPPVVELALRLNQVCVEHNASVLMLDGPQAWKADKSDEILQISGMPENPPPIQGLPASYERFVGYCLALYDALGRLGWRRLANREHLAGSANESPRKTLVESYPEAAWKSLGMEPLPARSECRVSHLAEAYAALTDILPITTNRPPNHAQLQAIIGGLPGLAIEERRDPRATPDKKITRQQPRWKNGKWREGLIVLPVPPQAKHVPWPTLE